MKIEGNTIILNSIPALFYREEEGRKPHTERIMTKTELDELEESNFIERITRIKIVHTQVPESDFTRSLTDVRVIGELFGFYLVTFSWQHEEREDKK